MSAWRIRAAIAATLLLGAVAPASAGADWTAPITLSAPGQDAVNPQVAVDNAGDAAFTWERFDGRHERVQARVRSASGTLHAIEPLSAHGQDASHPQVAVDSDGRAFFVWERSDGNYERVKARIRGPAGGIGPAQGLSAAGQDAVSPQVAVDPRGGAFFIWTRFDGVDWRIQVRRLSADGVLGPVLTLSAAGGSARQPQIAADPDGGAVFTWVRRQRGGDPLQRGDRIQARALSAAGVLSPIQTLAGVGQGTALDPQVAVDPVGNAAFTWVFAGVQARARSASGALSPVQSLDTNPDDDYSGGPQVAVDDAGNAVFAWTGFSHIAHAPGVEFAVRSAAGDLGPLGDLGPGSDVQVALDGAGNALFAWESRYPGVPGDIQVRTRAATATLGPTETLAQGQDGLLPQVDVNPAGDAAVVWENTDGTDWQIQAAVRSG
jgi:hypothetical protein